ncbi:glycine zipper 2TM domain-containing protein [Pseudorhodoferax sp. Leaf267]|uniref:glycine zipper 2TM domain-containing protein n=1 Tax=Pseudorhodoferax sp. Leaf267 TaxID=1736316 RepID=UPI0007000A79|nr:glycine zipper 2TM domain-containing protein [Pseudorhodoferax sp. Leaf267]KQP20577.1 hypothetical protein ASF43_27525 [Pseudorhodoferax sp. Leaf267]
MKHIFLLCGAGLASAAVLAQEVGTVVSATPVLQQVAVPRLVCHDQQVAVTPQRSGAGAVIGAIAGGVLGSAFGGGSGQAAAAAFGALGGAVLGNQVEAQQPTQIQSVQNCSTQTFYESRATYYDVVYDFAGKRYSVQMPQDPGPTVQLQVTPVGSPMPPVQAPARIVSSNSYARPAVEQVTIYQQQPVYTYPAPVYAPPVYAAPSYVAPLAIGLGIGYIGGHFSSRGRGYYGPPRGYYRH